MIERRVLERSAFGVMFNVVDFEVSAQDVFDEFMDEVESD